ncbi:MAG: hypothetical protein C0469_01695 [Cyanobacteria bacterium DS2.3.42]|nr:hypothetical protein [Cyanobacteria bacterium DS2.3.42]
MRKQSPRLKNSTTLLAAALILAAPLQANAQFNIGADDGGGTIDIQANEQEFADDHVIARGNVRVIYKDSIIDAPLATLYKDAAGKPQRAIFTGHPRLRQGQNLIHADKLTFEMASSIIIAEGNAHSEVIPQDGSNATKASKKADAKAAGKKAPVKVTKTDIATEESPDGDTTGEATVATDVEPKAAPAPVKDKAPVKQDKIITDADRQQYNRTTGQFDATGNVRVKTGDIFVKSDKLKLVYDAEQKPETALFTGNVKATQNANCTEADLMTYFLTTKRLQATGHVKSTVVQTKQAEATKKGGPFIAFNAGAAQKPVKPATPVIDPSQQAPVSDSNPEDIAGTAPEPAQADPIVIFSDSQDYSENTGRSTADGNVKLFYQDTIGVAPKMVMVKNLETGQTEKVLLYGRCQITQTGKRWIADRITYTVADNKVIAEGNTKAFILQNGPKGPKGPIAPNQVKPTTGPMFAMPKNTLANEEPKKASGNTKLSAREVDIPK